MTQLQEAGTGTVTELERISQDLFRLRAEQHQINSKIGNLEKRANNILQDLSRKVFPSGSPNKMDWRG